MSNVEAEMAKLGRGAVDDLLSRGLIERVGGGRTEVTETR